MELFYKIWFSRIEIPNKVKLKILDRFSEKKIWNMTFEELKINLIDCDEKYLKKISDENYKNKLDKYEKYMENKNIKLFSFKDNRYPGKLKNINDKPAYIYLRGNEKILDEDNVAIVGSRDATEYGKFIARKFAKEISDRNINIVSGLALGIDKYAHLGSLDSKIGKTIAVLGTGVADEDIYPYENSKVFERILENGGSIISEYIIGTKPLKYNFPARNRIISGLSDKIIVVEAKEKSGSLITVNYALEQGKDIFAVPGNIFSQNHEGINNLLKEGAYIMTCIDDLFLL